jgi:hypothetical protein
MPLRIPCAIALAAVLGFACTAPAHAGPARSARDDQVAALRSATRRLALYPPPLWVGVEPPGTCRALPSGRRSCPIAITLRVWGAGGLEPWRCAAHVLLPAPGRGGEPHRTSADCAPGLTASA